MAAELLANIGKLDDQRPGKTDAAEQVEDAGKVHRAFADRQVLIHGSVVVRELHLPNSVRKGSNKLRHSETVSQFSRESKF